MPIQTLSPLNELDLLNVLKLRFEKNTIRHPHLHWSDVLSQLNGQSSKLWSLNEMEISGGEPDVIAIDKNDKSIVFFNCAPESPIGRRSLCYDKESLESRKENKPLSAACILAKKMGVEILSEQDYRQLQQVGEFDLKTSSWIQTPVEIRKLGGALFADRRYNQVFVYHNGAQSYYAARGFRAKLSL
ncbi:MAG: DUF4256 domain-containing protein [Bacteroidia bacterium]|nr:DUF4256 domain-containing protein [Bacteroidia bacterium]